MVLAIISFFTGLVPLAVVAVYYASRVKLAWDTGDAFSRQEAVKYSRRARNWAVANLVIAVVMWTAVIVTVASR